MLPWSGSQLELVASSIHFIPGRNYHSIHFTRNYGHCSQAYLPLLRGTRIFLAWTNWFCLCVQSSCYYFEVRQRDLAIDERTGGANLTPEKVEEEFPVALSERTLPALSSQSRGEGYKYLFATTLDRAFRRKTRERGRGREWGADASPRQRRGSSLEDYVVSWQTIHTQQSEWVTRSAPFCFRYTSVQRRAQPRRQAVEKQRHEDAAIFHGLHHIL